MKTVQWSRFTHFLLLLLFSEYLVMLLSWVSHPADGLQLDWQQPLKQASTCRRFWLEQISSSEQKDHHWQLESECVWPEDQILSWEAEWYWDDHHSKKKKKSWVKDKNGGTKARCVGGAGPSLPHLVMFCEHKQSWNPKWRDRSEPVNQLFTWLSIISTTGKAHFQHHSRSRNKSRCANLWVSTSPTWHHVGNTFSNQVINEMHVHVW